MTAQDLKSNAVPLHLKGGGIYNTAYTSDPLDMARYVGGVILLFGVSSVSTGAVTVTLEDSDDGSTFDPTSYSFVEPIGAPLTARNIYIESTKVRRYVRLSANTSGTAVLTGGNVDGVAFRKASGEIPAQTWSIDASV